VKYTLEKIKLKKKSSKTKISKKTSQSELKLPKLEKIMNTKALWDSFDLAKRTSTFEKIYIENPKLGFKAIFIGNSKEDISPDNTERPTNGRFWDYAYRPSGQNPVHILTKAYNSDKYLFVLQPRPPLRTIIISSPAGLIETNLTMKVLKKDFCNTEKECNQLTTLIKKDKKLNVILLNGIKELKEESGYFPLSIKALHKLKLPKSAGMTDESAYFCYATVDPLKIGKGKLDIDKKTGLPTEEIKYIWLTPKEYIYLLEKANGEYLLGEMGDYMYFLGLSKLSESLETSMF
jgi:hypothetical protein